MGEQGALRAEHLRRPRPGPGICVDCFNTTDGSVRCFACATSERILDAIVPISYSVAHEPLHEALWRYKRTTGSLADRAATQLVRILSAFLVRHELCVARASGVPGFDVVTTVPSGDRARDERHPLRRLVADRCPATHGRHERLLLRTEQACPSRTFDPERYIARRELRGASILLIDDTWTTGASAQSAAAALRTAGARRVAAVVIGRHLNRHWHENDLRLRAIDGRFDFGMCVVCADRADHSWETNRAA